MDRMVVSVNPHIYAKDTTQTIMRDVLIALFPAVIASIVFFGIQALLVEAVCVAVAVLCEWAFEKICKKPITVTDLSAAVTGLLLGLNLPVSIPLWQAAFGSFVAIIVVKQFFGGIGQNFANPAITARVIMLVAFSGAMTNWVPAAFSNAPADAVTAATPLALLGSEGVAGELPTYLQMFLGARGGSMGETSCLALLIGFIYLLYRRVISWHTPVAFIGTVLVCTALLGQQPLYQVMAGGLFIGAIFMATDYTTSPPTPAGKLIFGVGCGLITVLIRVWGNYPEGVSFSILLMNILNPYISGWTKTKPFGGVQA
ncbi:MAG: RnfABCDGE type electron transport complex subunit D [Oscillospiraceae bacterium]|nr:RnfABCDGE type electron transport complex subunit D [Oscillospiraceae bacterium]MDE7170660.1 RnfABCDGE type electron transport complex subunit D [Oscillospiraceae bacterium]